MPFAVPFAGVQRRIACLRAILLVACFVTLLMSRPLWMNDHAFPLLPIAAGFPVLAVPWDRFLYGAMLLSLVLAGWFYRPAVICFLSAGLFAFFEDQNRGQPWFYMYSVMLGLTLLPEKSVLAAGRCAVAAAYLWSGIQKCNSVFFHNVPAWFVAPAARWHSPTLVITLLRWAVATAPLVEIAIAIALWSARFRCWGIALVVLVHLAALLFLGPLGYGYDFVVWPWNLAMMGFVIVLFGRVTESGTPGPPASSAGKAQSLNLGLHFPLFARTIAELRTSRLAVTIIALFTLLPALSFAGLWDSYFSFTLFAESQAKADIYVTEVFRNRLPPGIAAHVHKFRLAFDPRIQGPYVFDFQTWGYKTMRAPPIFEPRNYRSIFRYLRGWSRAPGDLHMIIAPRAGPIVFYEGDARVPLVPNQ